MVIEKVIGSSVFVIPVKEISRPLAETTEEEEVISAPFSMILLSEAAINAIPDGMEVLEESFAPPLTLTVPSAATVTSASPRPLNADPESVS